MSNNSDVYDVVIVGAGIAGAIVAKQLAAKGHSVLVLEAGTGDALKESGYQGFVENYQGNAVKVPNSAYPNNPNAPQSMVTDPQPIGTSATNSNGYFVQRGPNPFASSNTRTTGGTTLHWLGTSLRMLASDFEMKARYGVGADWPIPYDEMRPYYQRAENEIGVAANKADQEGAKGVPTLSFDPGYDYPMKRIPPSYVDRVLGEAIDGMACEVGGEEHELYVVSTPQARNSDPRGDYRPVGNPNLPNIGERCEGNSSCIPICPVQAKYNATRTFGTLAKDKVELRVQCVASSVDIDPDSGRISGIGYKRYASPGAAHYVSEVARGRVYVVAAHTVETAKLLLASGAARTSGQLGRNLMDHPTLLTWGLMPKSVGSYRGPGSTSGIPSLRDGGFRKAHSGFRVEIGNWGWNWAAGAPDSTVDAYLGLAGSRDGGPYFGADLQKKLYEECQRHFRLAFLVEQTPLASNRVTVDPEFRDALGNFRPVVYYEIDEYTRQGLKAAWEVSKAVYARAGIEDHTEFLPSMPGYLEVDGQPLVYYGAGHIVGTHRMGRSPNDSVTDSDMRCWDHENMFLVGCGSMPTIGTSNPTLTLSALAMRASDAISRQLEGKAVAR